MKLGFYYHINAYCENEFIFLPQYYGIFIDELAYNVDTLYYFAFETKIKSEEYCYILKSKNIKFINLGKKKSFPWLVLFGFTKLIKFQDSVSILDNFLVRAPSPLAPHFYFVYRKVTKISFLLVGDYLKIMKLQTDSIFRKPFVLFFGYLNDFQQKIALRKTQCIVNSRELKIKYLNLNSNINEVRTTSIYQKDFFEKTGKFYDSKIKLLFVGNIDKTKGLEELFEVFLELLVAGFNLELNLVGWERPNAIKYLKFINEKTNSDNFIFHGFKAGDELMEIYRACDIFVLPSHHEGFPRVIWEAMASSLPVISTKVGSIPYYLNDREHALLIEPRDKKALYNSIVELIEDENLRIRLIKNAYNLVQQNTADIQVKKLVNIIR